MFFFFGYFLLINYKKNRRKQKSMLTPPKAPSLLKPLNNGDHKKRRKSFDASQLRVPAAKEMPTKRRRAVKKNFLAVFSISYSPAHTYLMCTLFLFFSLSQKQKKKNSWVRGICSKMHPLIRCCFVFLFYVLIVWCVCTSDVCVNMCAVWKSQKNELAMIMTKQNILKRKKIKNKRISMIGPWNESMQMFLWNIRTKCARSIVW